MGSVNMDSVSVRVGSPMILTAGGIKGDKQTIPLCWEQAPQTLQGQGYPLSRDPDSTRVTLGMSTFLCSRHFAYLYTGHR